MNLSLGSSLGSVAVASPASAPIPFADNYSIDLDGSDDFIDVSNFDPSSEIGTGAFTMSMWMKPDSDANQIFWYMGNSDITTMMRMNYLASSGGFKIWANISNTWTDQYPHVNITTTTNRWYNVTVVRSGTTVTLYVNGTNSDSKTHASLATGFGSEHNVGKYRTSHHLDGHINDYAIWDEALTSSEVIAIYNNGVPIDLSADSGNYASSANLIGYWKMEENTGTSIADSSSNSNAATLTNGPAFSSDVPLFNYFSLDFDGTNDYLSTSLVTNTYSFKNGFSASLWVKLDDVSTTQDFFGRYGNSTGRFYFGISGTKVRAAIGTSYDTSTLSHGMSTGTWYHVAYTFSGGSSGTFTYYLNGSSVGTISFTWTTDSGSYEPMHIGGLKNGGNVHQNPTNGKLDELALYNSALSASDITAIYNSGAPANQASDSDLVAYWRMEEGSGTSIADSSSNSNTATLNNGPTFSTDTP
jgi:hypothetical protein